MQASASRRIVGAYPHVFAAVIAFAGCAGATAECEVPAGELVAAEAVVELRASGETTWRRIAPPHPLCEGDQVAVRSRGRAAVLLRDDVLVRLDEQTTLNLAGAPSDDAAGLGLPAGVIHVISRFRKRFGVTTPFVNALVEGTEFTVESDAAATRIVVAEGVVRASNPRGERSLAAGDAVEAAGDAAPAPISVRPLDAVRWAIHYPQIVWLDDAALATLPPATRDAVARAQRETAAGRSAAALAVLTDAADAAAAPLRASVLLALGRVDDARALLATLPDSADAAALDAVIRVSRNENDAALAAARRALATAPDAASGHLALSYALQARRDPAGALDAARRAVRLAPANPFAWARQAELELSLADIERGRGSAEHALARAGELPRAQALLGFARLLAGDTEAALETFRAAIAADASDPLAHFGSGLARLRAGALAAGRRDVEIAVLLDPTNAELRSYLGRLYVEEDRPALGASQFGLARRLDPASPTPWHFDAFRRLRDNDPLGAIAAGTRAIALNDNRAVFRSSELLDIDRAARSVTLGAAYRDVGFDEPMRAAAMRALADDPMSPAGHRLLAEAYAEVPRFEAARVAELLQAQLRQPIGQWPVPPQLLGPRLPLVEGPRALSPEESSALFDRGPRHFAASALGGSEGTRGASVVASSSTERTQLSLGHFDYRRDGLGARDDIDLSGTRLEAVVAATPHATVYAELGRLDRSGGDVARRLLEGVGGAWDQRLVHDVDTERGRLSLRYAPDVDRELIVTAAAQDGDERSLDQLFRAFPGGIATDLGLDVRTRFDASELGVLYAARGREHGIVAGADTYREARGQIRGGTQVIFIDGMPVSTLTGFSPEERATNEQDTGFAYGEVRPAPRASLHVGASYVSLRAGDATSVRRANPKLGATFALGPATTLRVAAFDGVKGPKFHQQTLEPTQFAGFNQRFDDVDGTRWRRRAAGLDHRFANGIGVGAEWSRRRLGVPGLGCLGDCRSDWREDLHRAYVAVPFGSRAALSVAWRYERLRLVDDPADLDSLPHRTRTELLPVALWLRLAARWSARVEAVRVRQDATMLDDLLGRDVARRERLWLANARVAYSRPDRRLALALTVHNVFDRDFAFHDTDLAGDPKTPLFHPGRTVLLHANVQF